MNSAKEAGGSITLVDIEAILRSRLGRKARYVPGFVFRWLKDFIHEDFINTYLKEGREGVDFCRGTLDYLGIKLTVEGLENLPRDGRHYTFASNHPLGAVDGVTLGAVLGEAYGGKVKYLVNDLLMNLQGLAPLCVPVNKLGRGSRNAGLITEDAIHGNITDILDGTIPGRENDKEFIYFTATGLAYVDVSIAYAMYQKALAAGVGRETSLQDSMIFEKEDLKITV